MRQYKAGEILFFLKAVDHRLTNPFTLIVIGGSAAALAYNTLNITKDIDTMNDISPITAAYEAAKHDTGMDIPMGPAGVAEAPYYYEDRLIRLDIPKLKKLTILVPEKHDLVLMKVVRGYEHDLATIEEIAKNCRLDYEILLSRFQSEMTHVIGRRRNLKLNFLAAIERIYGEKKAEEASKRLTGKKH